MSTSASQLPVFIRSGHTAQAVPNQLQPLAGDGSSLRETAAERGRQRTGERP
jgi:hypothetical protein